MRELCLYLPAKNPKASFIVVSLWCHKSGTTSLVWGKARSISIHSRQYTVKCIYYSITNYTMEVNRASLLSHAPDQNKLYDFAWWGRWLICSPWLDDRLVECLTCRASWLYLLMVPLISVSHITKPLESPLDSKEIKPINSKGNQR